MLEIDLLVRERDGFALGLTNGFLELFCEPVDIHTGYFLMNTRYHVPWRLSLDLSVSLSDLLRVRLMANKKVSNSVERMPDPLGQG